MQSIDVFTCYTLAGAGSLVGLLLVSLVRVEHPRLRRALWLYRMAFLCIASLLLVGFVAPQDRSGVTLRVVAVAASGATLLAWGFRQLGGQHTPVPLGLGLTLGVGGLLWWAGQHTPMAVFSVLEATVLSAIALVTLIDQGTLMLGAARLGSPRRRGGEVAFPVAVAVAMAHQVPLADALAGVEDEAAALQPAVGAPRHAEQDGDHRGQPHPGEEAEEAEEAGEDIDSAEDETPD